MTKIFLYCCCILTVLQADDLNETRQIVRESIELQRTLQREDEAWKQEKLILERQLQFLQRQKKDLEHQVLGLQSKKSQLQQEQMELRTWAKTQQQWIDQIEKIIENTSHESIYQNISGNEFDQPFEITSPEAQNLSLVDRCQRLLKKQVLCSKQHGKATIVELEVNYGQQLLTKKVLQCGRIIQYCDFNGMLLYKTNSTAWTSLIPTPPHWETTLKEVNTPQIPELVNLPIPKVLL
jgi:hypothetical protein